MALGLSLRPAQRRNDIIRRALRDVKAIKLGEAVDGNMMREGVEALNAILREEDHNQTGNKRFLHALTWGHLFLQEEKVLYTVDDGLAADIRDLQAVSFRDFNGGDTPLHFITPKQYEEKNKLDTGDPQTIFLKEAQDPALNELFVWPKPRSIGTTSVVVGTDAENYVCILKHTSSTENKPITGNNWPLYWRLAGSAGSVWAADTEYANGAIIRYLYSRALFNFDTLDDDPDVPDGWANYLRWRLAADLSSAFGVSDTDRSWFERQLALCELRLFPSNAGKTTDFHNKAVYF